MPFRRSIRSLLFKRGEVAKAYRASGQTFGEEDHASKWSVAIKSMSETTEFSVIIPTHNRVELLSEAIESVRTQTHKNYELIVVDDGSTDGTADFLRTVGSDVKVLQQSNRGPGAARNCGARHAIGAYLAFLDSDDVWFPWTLATFSRVIERYGRPPLIVASTVEFEGAIPGLEREDVATELFSDYFNTASSPGYVGSGALVVSRATFATASGFDERLSVGEDLDFYFRVGESNAFARLIRPVTLAYRRHPENISRVSSALYDGAIEILRREANGLYPGGHGRKRDRVELLSRMVRPVALSCLNAGLSAKAWDIYRMSFDVNLRSRRFRFLIGFFLKAVLREVMKGGTSRRGCLL